MGELEGKTALVTGAARGFGRAVALALAREGADVALADLAGDVRVGGFRPTAAPDDLAGAVEEVEALGRRAIAIRADVTSAEDCHRTAEEALAALGKIDVLVANAGIASLGLAWELTEEEWDVLMDVNLKGVWLTTKYVIPHMIERRAGSIVLVASRSGLRGEPNCAHYVAAKHGVVGYMRALAIELGPYEINVNAICPSGMGKQTEADRAPWWDDVAGHADPTPEEFDRAYGRMNLFERLGRHEYSEVAECVVWLASDRARLLTGCAVPFDGGYVAKRGG